MRRIDWMALEGAQREALLQRPAVTMGDRVREQSVGIIEQVKKDGYGVDCDEEREGMRCIGAAVMNEKRYPVAAIWLTGPSSRIPKRDFSRLGNLCIEAAQKISKKLGA